MTVEEAHKIQENLQRQMTNNRHLFTTDEIAANGLAILALEKQIPKKPTLVKPPAFLSYWKCAVCGERLCFDDEMREEVFAFCPNCG